MVFHSLSTDRAAAFRSSALSLANICSMGLRSGMCVPFAVSPAKRTVRLIAWLENPAQRTPHNEIFRVTCRIE